MGCLILLFYNSNMSKYISEIISLTLRKNQNLQGNYSLRALYSASQYHSQFHICPIRLLESLEHATFFILFRRKKT